MNSIIRKGADEESPEVHRFGEFIISTCTSFHTTSLCSISHSLSQSVVDWGWSMNEHYCLIIYRLHCTGYHQISLLNITLFPLIIMVTAMEYDGVTPLHHDSAGQEADRPSSITVIVQDVCCSAPFYYTSFRSFNALLAAVH